MRGLAGDVAQPGQNRAGCGKESIFAGGGRELGETRPQDEPPLHVACNQAVVLECDSESMRGGSSQTRGGDQPG